jgi:hypothetical protein
MVIGHVNASAFAAIPSAGAHGASAFFAPFSIETHQFPNTHGDHDNRRDRADEGSVVIQKLPDVIEHGAASLANQPSLLFFSAGSKALQGTVRKNTPGLLSFATAARASIRRVPLFSLVRPQNSAKPAHLPIHKPARGEKACAYDKEPPDPAVAHDLQSLGDLRVYPNRIIHDAPFVFACSLPFWPGRDKCKA